MSVKDQDNGYSALVERIFGLESPKISVGIHEADGAQDHGDDGLSIVALAAIHEFGIGVPERSFLRAWFDENEDRAKEALRRMLESVVLGKRTPDQALETFALWAVGEIQARIAKGIAPELAPSTIAAKGSTVPLIDTGQLRSSISYEILNADGSLKERGASEAAVARQKKAVEAKRTAKAGDRKASRERARERKAIRKEAKKTLTRAKRDVKKAVKKTLRKVRRAIR